MSISYNMDKQRGEINKIKKTKLKNLKNNGNRSSYRQYEHSDMIVAARKVRHENFSIYKASKHTGVPYNSLKRFLNDNEDLLHCEIPKLGRPFALSADLEHRLFNYIIEMQELGFGLTVMQVRKIAFDLAESANRQHMFNPEKKIASKWWWCKFKERYNLCLRVPENLSAYRASMANPVIISDYFTKLEDLLLHLNIKDQPSRIWNVDETGLTYVVRANKIVCQIGKKYIYKRTYAEKGQTQTVVGCACADGTFIPPFVIFKGIRWHDSLKNNCLPNSETHVSPKGWITSELFIKWFRFFIKSVPDLRPLVLLMDSHSSHVGPEVINMAKENQVYLMTFPAHTSHLLQPLDVGVYKPLKSHWSKQINNYMIEHPEVKPSRTNFHELFTPAFLSSFTPDNIRNAFKKSGVLPLNPNAIAPEALAPSKVTDRATTPTPVVVPSEEKINMLLQTPKVSRVNDKSSSTKGKRKRSAECLTPVEFTSSEPGCSKPSTLEEDIQTVAGSSKESDWTCGVCKRTYSADVKKKTGAKWVQCSFCLVPYHEKCQKFPTKEDVYMCDACCDDEFQNDGEDTD